MFSRHIFISLIAFVVGHVFIELLNAHFAWHVVYVFAFIGLILNSTRDHNNVFVFRVIVPVVIGLGFVVLYQYAYEVEAVKNFLSASKDNRFHLERLFEVLSTLYAICTAFLLWKGLTDHDTLRQILKEEAGQIQSILGYLNYLEGNKNLNLAAKIRKNLRKYISRILKGSSIKTHKGNYELLNKTRNYVSELDQQDYNDRIATSEIIKGLNNFFRIRMKRISQMENRISPYILMALGFMSLSIIYVIFTEPPSDTVVIETIIFILTVLLSFMIMMLIDISQPFEGYWKIKTDAFADLSKNLESEIRASEIKVRRDEVDESM